MGPGANQLIHVDGVCDAALTAGYAAAVPPLAYLAAPKLRVA